MKPSHAGYLGLAAIVLTLAVGCASSATTGTPTTNATSTSATAGAITTAHTSPPAAHPATAKATSHTPAPAASTAPATTQAAPPRTTAAPPVRASTTPIQATSAPPQAGCYPLTNGGNCYEPGEYCRSSDHGVTGVAGDGETIKCEYNNGWRWEPI